MKMRCDLCDKYFSPQLLVHHLSTHLDHSLQTLDDNNTNSILRDTSIHVCRTLETTTGPLISHTDDLRVKQEFSDHSDDDSNWSAINDMSDELDSTDEECEEQESRGSASNSKRNLRSVTKDIKNEELSEKCGLVCNECEKSFKSQLSLSIHLAKTHKIEGKYQSIKCYKCGQSLPKRQMRAHLLEEHDISTYSVSKKLSDLSCSWPECERTFRTQSTLDNLHLCSNRKHTGDLPFKCQWPGCDRQYDKQQRLDGHVTMHTGEKPFACEWPGCGKSFRHYSTLKSHAYTHDKNIPRKHVCYYPACDRSYDNPAKLNEHIYSVHKKDEKPFKCTEDGCNSTFISAKNMRLHLRTIHTPETRVRYKCSVEGCEKTFFEKKVLDKHEARKHADRAPVVKKKRKRYPPKPGSRKFKYTTKSSQCDWPGCDYKAEYPAKVNLHKMRVHTGEKPVACQWPGC
ncbi:unnamed protein product, partial [Oppiella nova]